MATRPDNELYELLPWYLNGSLAPDERAEVEALLSRQPEARARLEELRALAEVVREEEQRLQRENPLPLAMGWARLQRDIAPPPTPSRVPWRPALAAAALLVITLQSALLLRGPAPQEAAWQPLSGQMNSKPMAGGYRVQLRLVDSARWQQVRELLQQLNAEVVEGPSAMGVLQVQVPANARFQDGRALLQWLQQQPEVQHAALMGAG